MKARSVVDGYLRPGDTASVNGLAGFIKKIMAETTSQPSDITFRLDKGLTSGALLDDIEEAGSNYVAKAKLTKKLMKRISGIKNWRSIGGGVFAANIRYRATGWKNARRFCVIELNTEHFFANDALFITGLIAYNLINCIKCLALPKPYRTARLKRISLLFLNLGANLVKHGGRLRIKIGRDYPFRLIFHRAVAAMTAA